MRRPLGLIGAALLWSAFGSACPSGAAAAQEIIGKVLAASDQAPVAFALISVRRDGEEPITQVMSDVNGNFSVDAGLPEGQYLVAAERIGFRTAETGPIAVQSGNAAYVRLPLSTQVLDLEGVTVAASGTECGADQQSATIVEQLWTEAQKSLRMVTWAGDNADIGFEIMTRTTDTSFDEIGSAGETTQLARGAGSQPFIAVDASILRNDGFVARDEEGRLFFAPDASYLLSPDFVETHCLEWRGPSEDEALVALAFNPRRARRVPEIAGRIWLDSSTGALSHIEFDYVNVAFGSTEAKASGWISFATLTSGEWLVDDWWIRTPRIGVRPRQIGFEGEDSLLIGFRERGGTVVRAWTGETASLLELASPAEQGEPAESEALGRLPDAVAPTIVATTDSVSTPNVSATAAASLVFGRITDADTGSPIADVEVSLTGADQTTVTDEAGNFEFPPGSAGEEVLRMGHLAYGQHDEPIEIPEGKGLELAIRLEVLPVEVAGIDVEGEASRARENQISGARFDGLGPAEIDEIRPRVQTTGDLVRAARIPGLIVTEKYMPFGPLNMPTLGLCITTNRMRSRGGTGDCAMVEVYINDVRMADPAVQLQGLNPETISHFELIPAIEAGARYGTGSQNGVLVIHSRVN